MRLSHSLFAALLLAAACGGDNENTTGSGGAGGGTTSSTGGGGGETFGKCGDLSDAPPSDPLTYLGRAQGTDFIEILDVVHRYPTIFACTSVAGLNIWDATSDAPIELASDIAPPGLVGINNLAHCQHVGLDPNSTQLVITNRGDEIQPQPFIYLGDFPDPANGTPLAGWTGPESIEGVALRDGRIWAAAHGDGIMVLDHTGSGMMGLTEVARFSDAESDAWYPLLHGDVLLVAEGATGVRLYDVSGDMPSLLSSVPIDGSSKDIVIQDDVAYVAASSRIVSIDISDPTSPSILGEYETAGTAVALTIGLNNTLLVAEWEKVRGYDISDPANLTPELSEVLPPKDGALFSRVLTLEAVPEASRFFGGEWNGLHAYEQIACGVGPDIETSPDQISFSTVAPGEMAAASLILHNNGNKPLNISDITPSSPDLSLSTTELTIPPGEGDFVEVTFAPSSTNQLQGTLTLISDDIDEGTFELRVSGNIPGIDVGDPLPAFNLLDTDGVMWSNADLDGKVAVMAYFATF